MLLLAPYGRSAAIKKIKINKNIFRSTGCPTHLGDLSIIIWVRYHTHTHTHITRAHMRTQQQNKENKES